LENSVKKTDSELALSLRDKFKAAVEHETWRTFIQNATNDFEFKEGIQWSSSEISALQARGQAATVENEIKPIIDRIIGQYKTMKTRIIFKGRNAPPPVVTPEMQAARNELGKMGVPEPPASPNTGQDETHSDILSALALHIQQNSDYEFEEGDMFDDGQSCGFGCLEVFIDYEKDLTPKIVLRAENALNIFPDPNSRSYDWNKDAEFLCRAKWVSFNRAVKLYPQHKELIESYINSNPVANSSQTMERNDFVDYRLKRIRLVEVWYKEVVKRKMVLSEVFLEPTEVSDADFKKIREADPSAKLHESIEDKIYVGILCGETLVGHKESPYEHNLFPFIPYFVFRRKNGEPYSIVRMLKDPQMEINKRRSKALHLLSTNQAVFEEGGVADEDDLKTEMAKPDGLIKFRKGFNFQINKNIDLAVSQINLQSESKTSMSRISGISDEAMARHSEVRSGIGLQRKQMMTEIITAPIFDNLRRTRQIIGRLIFELIKQFYTEEKVFSVTDDMKQVQHFAMTKDALASIKEGIYDIIIEEAPNTTTIQEEQFAYLAELVKGLGLPPSVGVALLPIFIRLSGLKNKDEVAKILEQLQQMPPEKPKVNLSLIWSELYPEEKAAFAQVMGYDDLAAFEMEKQNPPKHLIDSASKSMLKGNIV